MILLAFLCLATASFLFLRLPEDSIWLFPGAFLMGLGGLLALERILSRLESLKEDRGLSFFSSSFSSSSSNSYPNASCNASNNPSASNHSSRRNGKSNARRNGIARDSFRTESKTKQLKPSLTDSFFWIKKRTNSMLVLESKQGARPFWFWLCTLVLFFLLVSSFLFYTAKNQTVALDTVFHPTFFSGLILFLLSLYFLGIAVYFFQNKFKERIVFFLKEKGFQIQNFFSFEPGMLDFSQIQKISVVRKENSHPQELFYEGCYEVFLELSDLSYRFSGTLFSDIDSEIKQKTKQVEPSHKKLLHKQFPHTKFLARFFDEESLYSFLSTLVSSVPISVHFSKEADASIQFSAQFSARFQCFKDSSILKSDVPLSIEYDPKESLKRKTKRKTEEEEKQEKKPERTGLQTVFQWKRKESFIVGSVQFFFVFMTVLFCLYSFVFFPSVFWIFAVLSAFFLFIFCKRAISLESLRFSGRGLEYRSHIARIVNSREFLCWKEIQKVYFSTEDLLIEREIQRTHENPKRKRRIRNKNHARSKPSVLLDIHGLSTSDAMLLKKHFLEYLPRHQLSLEF